jgi:hypothetical protein
LSPEQDARVRACRDETLVSTWLRRLVTAASVDDIFAD